MPSSFVFTCATIPVSVFRTSTSASGTTGVALVGHPAEYAPCVSLGERLRRETCGGYQHHCDHYDELGNPIIQPTETFHGHPPAYAQVSKPKH